MDQLDTLSEYDRWKSAVLDEIFKALVSSSELSKWLIYKGARVLRLRLQEILRASFDIDACLSGFAATAGSNPSDTISLERIRDLVCEAIVNYLESQDPVRYALQGATIANRRKIGPHPRGWDVYWLDLQVNDLARAETFSGPEGQLRIDIAAPELMSERSVSPLLFAGKTIMAITLERIAGEKIRAFLSSLPSYRKKIKEKTQIARRVKDLYDLVRIIRRQPIEDAGFWAAAGQEFVLACQSRCIDCEGVATVKEEWDEAKRVFNADPTLPKDVTFEEVEATVDAIMAFFAGERITPIRFDLPDVNKD